MQEKRQEKSASGGDELKNVFDEEFKKTCSFMLALMQKLILFHEQKSRRKNQNWGHVGDLKQVQAILTEAFEAAPEVEGSLQQAVQEFMQKRSAQDETRQG